MAKSDANDAKTYKPGSLEELEAFLGYEPKVEELKEAVDPSILKIPGTGKTMDQVLNTAFAKNLTLPSDLKRIIEDTYLHALYENPDEIQKERKERDIDRLYWYVNAVRDLYRIKNAT